MRLRPLAVLLTAGLALGACGGSGDDAAAPAADPLDFVAPTVDGGEVAGADYAGRDLVIWLWAPW